MRQLTPTKSFYNINEYMEAEQKVNTSLSIIDAEVGTITPALLKEYRAEVLVFSGFFFAQLRYSEALPHYEDNLTYYESIGNTENLIVCLTGLG